MFTVAGPDMTKVASMFPARRFKKLLLSATQILDIVQGFSQYRPGDIIQIPHVQFPPETKVISIMPDFHYGNPDHWAFLLYNDAWPTLESHEHIPIFEHVTNMVHVFKPV